MRDADLAVRLAPSPGRLRVRLRLAIAAGREAELAGLDPDDVDRFPAGGCLLRADLQAVAEKLRRAADQSKPGSISPVDLSSRMIRSALLSALGNHTEALAEANLTVARYPFAAEAWLLRATACRRAADTAGAMAAVESGLALAPGDSRLQTLRGRLMIEDGSPVAALRLARSGGRPGGRTEGARREGPGALGYSRGTRNRWRSGPWPFVTTPRTPMPSLAGRSVSPESADGSQRSPTWRVRSTRRTIVPRSWLARPWSMPGALQSVPTA